MNAQVIAVVNQKGGTGKSTTCARLGVGLVQAEKKVLVVDVDPQTSLSISLDHSQPDDLPVTLSNLMGKVRRQINPKLLIDGILLTMVDSRINFARGISALLWETYGGDIKVFDSEIPYSVRAKETNAEG